MRDRLIEMIQKAVGGCARNWAEVIADYLIANGVILPPVKVGEVVYEIQPIRKRVQTYEITTIKYNGHYWWFTWILKDRKGIYGNVEGFSSHQIGKTVFLTREEAEAALKGGVDDGEK